PARTGVVQATTSPRVASRCRVAAPEAPADSLWSRPASRARSAPALLRDAEDGRGAAPASVGVDDAGGGHVGARRDVVGAELPRGGGLHPGADQLAVDVEVEPEGRLAPAGAHVDGDALA